MEDKEPSLLPKEDARNRPPPATATEEVPGQFTLPLHKYALVPSQGSLRHLAHHQMIPSRSNLGKKLSLDLASEGDLANLGEVAPSPAEAALQERLERTQAAQRRRQLSLQQTEHQQVDGLGRSLHNAHSLGHTLGHQGRPLKLETQSSGDSQKLRQVRKPYTITKQRERWTEDEHQRFLEAVKLHGRAWRRIEEHIGSKTAVQIRSHAQKFFSKLERESSVPGVASSCPVEIPPPRPKRKPSHPYPRKASGSAPGTGLDSGGEGNASPGGSEPRGGRAGPSVRDPAATAQKAAQRPSSGGFNPWGSSPTVMPQASSQMDRLRGGAEVPPGSPGLALGLGQANLGPGLGTGQGPGERKGSGGVKLFGQLVSPADRKAEHGRKRNQEVGEAPLPAAAASPRPAAGLQPHQQATARQNSGRSGSTLDGSFLVSGISVVEADSGSNAPSCKQEDCPTAQQRARPTETTSNSRDQDLGAFLGIPRGALMKEAQEGRAHPCAQPPVTTEQRGPHAVNGGPNVPPGFNFGGLVPASFPPAMMRPFPPGHPYAASFEQLARMAQCASPALPGAFSPWGLGLQPGVGPPDEGNSAAAAAAVAAATVAAASAWWALQSGGHVSPGMAPFATAQAMAAAAAAGMSPRQAPPPMPRMPLFPPPVVPAQQPSFPADLAESHVSREGEEAMAPKAREVDTSKEAKVPPAGAVHEDGKPSVALPPSAARRAERVSKLRELKARCGGAEGAGGASEKVAGCTGSSPWAQSRFSLESSGENLAGKASKQAAVGGGDVGEAGGTALQEGRSSSEGEAPKEKGHRRGREQSASGSNTPPGGAAGDRKGSPGLPSGSDGSGGGEGQEAMGHREGEKDTSGSGSREPGPSSNGSACGDARKRRERSGSDGGSSDGDGGDQQVQQQQEGQNRGQPGGASTAEGTAGEEPSARAEDVQQQAAAPEGVEKGAGLGEGLQLGPPSDTQLYNERKPPKETTKEGRIAFQALFSRSVLPRNFCSPQAPGDGRATLAVAGVPEAEGAPLGPLPVERRQYYNSSAPFSEAHAQAASPHHAAPLERQGSPRWTVLKRKASTGGAQLEMEVQRSSLLRQTPQLQRQRLKTGYEQQQQGGSAPEGRHPPASAGFVPYSKDMGVGNPSNSKWTVPRAGDAVAAGQESADGAPALIGEVRARLKPEENNGNEEGNKKPCLDLGPTGPNLNE